MTTTRNIHFPFSILHFTFALGLLAGCAHTHYVSNSEVDLGEPDALTMSEKKAMVLEALVLLQRDPTFASVYGAKKAKLEKAAKERGKDAALPLIAMDILHNRMGNGVSDSRELGQVSRYLQNEIRKTGLFDVTDDFISPEMLSRIISGIDGGEDGGLEAMDYRSPDLWLTGELRKERDGKIHTFTLNLQLMDTATKCFFWSDTIERRKTR